MTPEQSLTGMPRGSFLSQVLVTAVANVLMAGLAVLTGILSARLLGPQGRGELAAIQLWPTLLLLLSELGMSDALVYYSAREPRAGLGYLATAVIMALATCVPVMVIAYAAMPLFLATQSWAVISAARGYLFLLPVNALFGLSYHILRGRGDFSAWNAARLIAPIVWLIVLLLGWGLGKHDPRFYAFSYLSLFAMSLMLVLGLVVKRIEGSFRPDVAKVRRLLGYGLACLLSGIPRLISSRLGQVMIAASLPAEMLGLYVASVAWSMMVNPLVSSISTTVSPRVASEGDRDRQCQIFAQASRATVLVSVLVTPGTIVCTPLILPVLFGRSFASAVPIACVLLGGAAIANINDTLGQGLRGFGFPSWAARAESVGAFVSVIVLLLLLGPLGMSGAAVASVMGSASVMFIETVQMTALTGYAPSHILIPTGYDIDFGCRQLHRLLKRSGYS